MARPGMNIAELERILEERRGDLTKLKQQRSDLEKKLVGVDKQIARIEGGMGGRGRRRRGAGSRVRNDKPLSETIAEVLSAKGKPMGVKMIVEEVLSTGYKSNSDNFKGIVNQTLIKDKRFGQVERGVYQLKK